MLTVVHDAQEANDSAGGAGQSLLDEIVRDGARQMLAAALQAEIAAYVAEFADQLDDNGHRLVVRNGYHQPREVLTAAGAVEVKAPRVNNRRVDPDTGERRRFSSAILPAWARKSPQMSEVLPLLYLHGTRRPGSSTGRWRWIPQSRAPISTPRTSPATQGAGSNYTNPGIEPPDHSIGRSRGGLTSKIDHLVDGRGRPMVVLVGPGHSHDGPVFEHLLDHLTVDQRRGRKPRTRPDRVRADKAYSNRATRTRLRRRGIGAVIPEPSDQTANRKRRGSRGGRPPAFDADDYKGRNVVGRNFNDVKQWRGLATRYDKLAIVYRAATVLRAITIWLPHFVRHALASILHRSDAGSFCC